MGKHMQRRNNQFEEICNCHSQWVSPFTDQGMVTPTVPFNLIHFAVEYGEVSLHRSIPCASRPLINPPPFHLNLSSVLLCPQPFVSSFHELYFLDLSKERHSTLSQVPTTNRPYIDLRFHSSPSALRLETR